MDYSSNEIEKVIYYYFQLNNKYCENYREFLSKQPELEIERRLRANSYIQIPDLMALLGIDIHNNRKQQ